MLLIVILAIVTVTSLTYYVLNQSNQTQNNPSPTPTPTPSPSETPTQHTSIPEPSVPEFTLTLADHSTVDMIFRNQQFPATIDGNPTVLYYDIAIKPHSIEDWWGPYDKGWFPAQTDSEFTTISFPRGEFPGEARLDFRAQVYLGYHYSYVDYSHIQPFHQSSFACSASDWSETQTITIP